MICRRFWLRRFRKLDMSLKDQRQALVDTFINAIYLYCLPLYHFFSKVKALDAVLLKIAII